MNHACRFYTRGVKRFRRASHISHTGVDRQLRWCVFIDYLLICSHESIFFTWLLILHTMAIASVPTDQHFLMVLCRRVSGEDCRNPSLHTVKPMKTMQTSTFHMKEITETGKFVMKKTCRVVEWLGFLHPCDVDKTTLNITSTCSVMSVWKRLKDNIPPFPFYHENQI